MGKMGQLIGWCNTALTRYRHSTIFVPSERESRLTLTDFPDSVDWVWGWELVGCTMYTLARIVRDRKYARLFEHLHGSLCYPYLYS